MVQRSTQTVDIRAGIRLTHATELLRGRIAHSAETGGIRKILLLELSGRAEVDEGHVAIRLEHDISGLHVPVNDGRLPGVEVPQHIAQLLGPLNDVLLRLGAVLLQCLVQGIALHVVHDDDERILRIDHVDDTRQIRVAQLLEDIRLRHQTLLHGFKIQYTVLADLLHCPGLVCLLIDGHIYDTHAALSDLVEDLIFSVNEGSYLQHPVPSIF